MISIKKSNKRKSKILLINPAAEGIYYKMGLYLPPLGIGYLAAVLRQNGYDVNIIDFNVEKKEPKEIPWEECQIVGISGDTSRHFRMMDLARLAKSRGKTVIVGGYHASFMEEEVLKSGNVDYVIKGEGEKPIVELLDCLENKGDLTRVSNLAFLKDGEVFRTPFNFPDNNLDELPWPARDLLPMKLYRSTELQGEKITTIVSSRGCPFNCTFCASSSFAGTLWRPRNVNDVVDEVETVVDKYNYGAIAFMDDNFTLNVQRVKDFCNEIIRRGLKLKWWCFSRVNTLLNNESLVEEMARAGTKMIYLGLESASQKVLDSYNKAIKVDSAAKVINMLHQYGIRVWGSFIMGNPLEKVEDLKHTVTYAKELDPDIAQFSILTPFPGTQLFQEAERNGWISSYDWSRYDGAHAVMTTPYLTPFQIARETLMAYAKFYGRFSRWHEVIDGIKGIFRTS